MARGCRVKRTTSQSIPAWTFTSIQFNQEDYDTDNFHDIAINNSRVVIPTSGIYIITANSNMPTGLAYDQFRILLNGTIVIASMLLPATTSGVYTVCTQYQLNAGDYIEFQVSAASGAGGTITSAHLEVVTFV